MSNKPYVCSMCQKPFSAQLSLQKHIEFHHSSGKGNTKPESTTALGGKKGKGAKQSKRKATDELWNEGNVPERINPLHPFLVEKLPRMSASTYTANVSSSPNTTDPSLDVLCLLRALHALNKYWGTLYTNGASMDMPGYYHPIILNSEFINSKLTAKVSYLIEEAFIIRKGFMKV